MAGRRRIISLGTFFRRLISLLLDVILIAGLIAIAGTLFGVRPYVVESGSMEPAIPTGSVCLINTRVPFETVRVGDVVCFESAVGKKVIHRAVSVTDEGIETKGDANENADGVTTTVQNYIGTVAFTAAGLGYAVYWIQSPRGMVICIAALLILFILAWEPGDKRSDRRRAGRKGRTDGKRARETKAKNEGKKRSDEDE